MGKRGPAKTPANILSMRGSRLADKRPKKPQPPTDTSAARAPACPAHLDVVAKREWRRVAPELVKRGILTDLDRAVLAAYCQRWSDYVEAVKKVAEGGAVKLSDKGNEYLSAWENRKTAALKDLVRFAAELGLSPVARTRIQVEVPEKPAPVRKRERRA